MSQQSAQQTKQELKAAEQKLQAAKQELQAAEQKLQAAEQKLQAAEASKSESLIIASASAILSSTTHGVVTAQDAVKTAQNAVTYWSNLLYPSPASPSHLSASPSAAKFNSFLSALDVSTALAIPFATSLTYLPLVQQTGHTQPAILGNKDDGARLFVRACYPKIWQLISQQRDAYLAGTTLRKATLVTGNAGVGKSIFLAYIIKQLRSLPPATSPAIIYHDLSATRCFAIPPGVAQATEYEQVTHRMVDNSSAVYLVDIGGTAIPGPLVCDAFTIVVASPHAKHKDIVKDWKKHSQYPPTFYMPCWSEEELQICRQVVCPTDTEDAHDALQGARLLPAVSAASVTERVQQFGGTARVVFKDDSYLPALKQELSQAISECNLEVMAHQVGDDLDLLPESSSWLLHYVVDEKRNFTISNIQFASQPILEKVWERSASKQHNSVLQFVDATSNNPIWTTTRGKIFERLATELLREGGAFYVHQFTDPRTPTRGMKGHRMGPTASLLQIPSSQLPAQPLPNAAAIAALAAGQYGEPNKTNFTTIDGALKPNLLFQMTVSSTHNVNIDGLIAAITALQLTPSDPPPRLYFVVPPQQFPTFQVGPFKSSHSTPVTSIPPNLEYWVLQLYPLTTASGKRKMPSSSLTPPPSPKAAATHITLPAASHSYVCSCKGLCSTKTCTCRKNKVDCNSNCHSGLAAQLSDPLQRHKNCRNHT